MGTQDPAAAGSQILHGNGLRPSGLIPMSVDDALQYSPLSSIVPFGSDTVPVPTVVNPDAPSVFSDIMHRPSHATLQTLNKIVDGGGSASALVQQTMHGLEQLLEPQKFTKIKFKNQPGFSHEQPQSVAADEGNGPSVSAVASLGRFSEMVLQATNRPLKFSTPGKRPPRMETKSLDAGDLGPVRLDDRPSPRKAMVDKQLAQIQLERSPSLATECPTVTPTNGPHTSSPAAGLPTPATTTEILDTRPSTALPAATTPTYPSHRTPTPETRPTGPSVIVPKLSPAKRKEYEVVATVDFKAKKKSRVEREDSDLLPSSITVSAARAPVPHEKSDATLRNLLQWTAKIFEASDQLQADTSGAGRETDGDLFMLADWVEEPTYFLAPAVHAEMDELLERTIGYGRFKEVPFDAISRLQKLCEGAVTAAESIDFKLPTVAGEDAIDDWLRRITAADVGLRSARILLKLLTGGREEKQLYSEEALQSSLNILKAVLETAITPIIELRSTGAKGEVFHALKPHKNSIATLLTHSIKMLQLLASLILSDSLNESATTTVEFISVSLIFVENASSDRDSVLGIHKCERLRVAAMDVLVQAFSQYSEHQAFIFDEILTSLEKLPITRQRARQYKLPDGKNIQLVSALILRLVQSSSTKIKEKGVSKSLLIAGKAAASEAEKPSRNKKGGEDELNPQQAMQQLFNTAQPIVDSAQQNAQYVIQFLVSRALKSTKTGDDPHRALLDIFAEDFLAVFESPDWPASEFLLRFLLTSMLGLMTGEKTAAPAKIMALDLLGLMGAALSEATMRLRKACKSLENTESRLDEWLFQTSESYLSGEPQEFEIVALNGPYQIMLSYNEEQHQSESLFHSARRFLVVQWASRLCSMYESDPESAEIFMQGLSAANLFNTLRNIIGGNKAFEMGAMEPVTQLQARTAYALITLSMPFGKAFERILLILLNSMNSDQATVRSKGLKSVILIIERDPTILDKGTYVMRHMLNRACDSSPLVRDSALGLIAKCLSLRPALDERVLECVIARASDSQIGVRKRSLKILRDIYLRSTNTDVKAMVSETLLYRMTDSEEAVVDVARELLEEMWMSPLASPTGERRESVQRSLAVQEQASLMVKMVQRGANICSALNSFLNSMLGVDSKVASWKFDTCRDVVATLFDEVVDNGDAVDQSRRQAVMRTLTVFARAKPDVFSAEQLEHLQIYVEHLSNNDDLHVFRSVIMIFRMVLPRITGIKTTFLAAVQKALLESLTKLGKRELNEVVSCLWTINDTLKTIERLSKVIISCIKAIANARKVNFEADSQKQKMTSLVRYMNIAGLFGKYCNFASDLQRFQAEFPWWQGDSVPALLIDVFAPFTAPTQPIPIRTAALDGFSSVCQAWPRLYLNNQVTTAFESVFAERNPELERLLLDGFREFLGLEEKRFEGGPDLPSKAKGNDEAGRLEVSIATSQNDGIASSLAQRYLKHIVRIALTDSDVLALSATEIIASVNRQGLVHPKECIPVLVALETSSNAVIAKTALREHYTLHEKHGSIVEKDYIKAAQEAFTYQKTLAGDVRGVTPRPFMAKLQPLYDVIKTSKGKSRKKFLSSLCTRIDFDPAKLDISEDPPRHLQLVVFVSDNIAFFDYGTIDEVLVTIACLERMVSTTGTPIAHAIETEVLRGIPASDGDGSVATTEEATMPPPVPPTRLMQLATSALILSAMWECRTYLCRLYVHANPAKQHEGKGKISAKDLTKAPTKHQGINGQDFWTSNEQRLTALASGDLVGQCRHFVDVMKIDHDFRLAADKDEEDPPEVDRWGAASSDEDEGSACSTPRPPTENRRKRRAARPSLAQTTRKRSKQNK